MAGDAVLEFTDDNFEQEVISAKVPVLVDFWAEWCMPCRMLAPMIDELAREFVGKVKVGKVDVDTNKDVSVKYDIQHIPTILLFQDGQLVRKFVGATPKKEFVAELQKLVQA